MPTNPDGPATRAQISVQRSGGFAGLTLHSAVDTDDLPPEEQTHYLRLLDGLDLPALAATPKAATSRPDQFQYDITVQLDDQSYDFRYGERDLPAPLKSLTQPLIERARKRS